MAQYKPYTHEELVALHDKMCKEARAIMVKKNQDYSGGRGHRDPFANFHGAALFNVQPEIGIIIRMNDKFKRVEAFIENGSLAVQGEGIADICHDLINYSVLLYGMLLTRGEDPRPQGLRELAKQRINGEDK